MQIYCIYIQTLCAIKSKMKRIGIVIVLTGILIGCQYSTKEDTIVSDFNIELRHFFGAEGYTVHYFVNQDSLKLRYDCDFENCKDTLLYETKLDEAKVKDLYSFLIESKYDTLKSKYVNDGFDGRYTFIKISGDSIVKKNIRMERYRHELIEELLDKVDLSIPEIKYRLYRHKYEEK